jgi:glutathione synthase/RimK-type ligase-like ATP-grasp enzyme
MKHIIALKDYKSVFGSKKFNFPYRSGMDKEKLAYYFNQIGYEIEYKYFNEVDFRSTAYIGSNIIYTSSEDVGYYYKSYIEDVIYGLEQMGANVMPSYNHLRANNNKVFMEFMRDYSNYTNNLKSKAFGALEDLKMHLKNITYPIVFKTAGGATGDGVRLINSENELIAQVKKTTKRNYKMDLWDIGRALKHKGYIKECRYRNKFIIQEFIPDLKNDWKILFYGEKLYIFKRPIQKGRDIRASGGGTHNYLYGLEAGAPDGVYDFALEIYKKMNVPHASIDVAYDGKEFYLIEFQSLYFGTSALVNSDGYFTKKQNTWEYIKGKIELEKAYADGVDRHLKKQERAFVKEPHTN